MLLLSALKPAEAGRGIVVRVLNPSDGPVAATLRMGVPFRTARPVRLDETPAAGDVAVHGAVVRFDVPARALRSILLSSDA